MRKTFWLRFLPLIIKVGLGGVLTAGLWGCVGSKPSSATSNLRPNIIVVFTDDQGYADLGCQGVLDDIRTPNLDRFAAEGVRMTAGYVTAPQCSPSRAGLLTGRYQQRFGFDDIADGPLPLDQMTLADRMTVGGYATGMVGKWHLEPNPGTLAWNAIYLPDGADPRRVPAKFVRPFLPDHRGFKEIFFGSMTRYLATYTLDGEDQPDGRKKWVDIDRFRVDVQTEAALAFIDRHFGEPFFLYVAYYAPHVPLEATEDYLDRFPGEMPERRRHALAMLSAIDDGVGGILDRLEDYGISENTLIFFISDNGAPLWIDKEDLPLHMNGWDGSVNLPLNGEKGMLLEGGVRVPYLLRWPAEIPGRQIVDKPASTLDVAPTVLAAAGLPPVSEMDGVDLLPLLNGEAPWPDRPLFWRFWNQAAVRHGPWKYLHLADGGRFLFDLRSDPAETVNVLKQQPDVAAALATELEAWSSQLKPAGLPDDGKLNDQESRWFGHYLQWAQ
ncbi:MAG: sulfatase [Desulfuromonas sp.]|uniref:sulfatase family protein n=1 Tax=Desulfuromonas sp. TaxID=892 RepID=UPI000CBD0D49|nr:sulfatase-like hydrolase/transferase [Desulfuromonas sp.]PLX86333.1 MAG: sulfatase [Desulfuromonas sp.]